MLSKEMTQMLDAIKEFDTQIQKDGNLTRYFAPNIPEKVIKKLIKNFDNNLPVNSVIAYYDTTLFNSSKEGIIFTNEGIYYKDFLGKAVYVQYREIKYCYYSIIHQAVMFDLHSGDTLRFEISLFRMEILAFVIRSLIQIDEIYGQTSFKQSGEVKKVDLPPDISEKCNKIIHTAAVACGGVGTGLAQLPVCDSAAIVPIQIGMIVGLGAVFELHITESIAKSLLATFAASYAGRAASQVLVGWIPGIGNAINTATAAGLTETIGWATVANFYKRWEDDKIKGRYEGMKAGYVEASGEYEQKLRKQAEEFLNQIKDVEREKEEYDNLLNEYEAYIRELEKKGVADNRVDEEKEVYNNLKKLKFA